MCVYIKFSKSSIECFFWIVYTNMFQDMSYDCFFLSLSSTCIIFHNLQTEIKVIITSNSSSCLEIDEILFIVIFGVLQFIKTFARSIRFDFYFILYESVYLIEIFKLRDRYQFNYLISH